MTGAPGRLAGRRFIDDDDIATTSTAAAIQRRQCREPRRRGRASTTANSELSPPKVRVAGRPWPKPSAVATEPSNGLMNNASASWVTTDFKTDLIVSPHACTFFAVKCVRD